MNRGTYRRLKKYREPEPVNHLEGAGAGKNLNHGSQEPVAGPF